MKEYKLSTARGKQMYEMGGRCCNQSLSSLYNNWSKEKENAFFKKNQIFLRIFL